MGLGSIGFFYALLFAMIVWMALRINRASTGMAVASFIFWPLAIIPLITNWGSRDSDIRLPFAVALLAAGMIFHSADQAAQDVAMMYSPSDIEAIRSEDPQFAAEIEREQLRALGIAVEVEPLATDSAASSTTASVALSVQPGSGGRRPLAVDAAPGAAPAATDEFQFAAAPAQIRPIPLRELQFRRGQVRLPPAFAHLDVPQHFRFVTAQQLGTLSELRGVAVSSATLGWLVHERVNLSSPDFWFVDVQFHESGHLAVPPAGATPAIGGTDILSWDADRAIAAWSSPSGHDEAGEEMSAAKLLRHGVVVYRLPDLGADQVELGLRAARLMASRTLPETGWAHAEYTGAASTLALTDWVAALSTQPAEAPVSVR